MVVVLLVFSLVGCEQKNEKVTQEPVQTQPEAKASVVEQGKSVVSEVSQQVSTAVVAGGEKLHQAGVEAEKAVKDVAVAAGNDLETGAVVAQEKVTELVTTVQQEADDVRQDSSALLTNLVDQAAEKTSTTDEVPAQTATASKADPDLLTSAVTAVADAVIAPAEPAAVLVIENAKGNVTLKHALHGDHYGCAVCHGEGTPAPFELGKSRAHKLCKDCHKEKNGPVSCSGCHEK